MKSIMFQFSVCGSKTQQVINYDKLNNNENENKTEGTCSGETFSFIQIFIVDLCMFSLMPGFSSENLSMVFINISLLLLLFIVFIVMNFLFFNINTILSVQLSVVFFFFYQHSFTLPVQHTNKIFHLYCK